ncbi:hypothetical protein GOB92_31780 [Sinorhizobium meliloti]|nr:hypothetical protein [Sinorhizobium meliloti]
MWSKGGSWGIVEYERVDVIQLDEPRWHSDLSRARKYGPSIIERALRGVKAKVLVHVCYGYAYFKEGKVANPAYAEVLELLAGCKELDGTSLEYEQPGHVPELLRHCGDKHVTMQAPSSCRPARRWYDRARHVISRTPRA